MNYYLYKLQFHTAVHFGVSDSALSLYSSEDFFCADTLFSALCHTANGLYGEAGIESLCSMARAGELLLSDGMPWKGDALYIPKPCVSGESNEEIPAQLRKAVKKLAYIPVNQFAKFADSVHGKGLFYGETVKFGVHTESTKARITCGEDTLPYQVGLYQFYPDCGLWFIAGCATEKQGEELEKLLKLLGITGIGGKTTAGYGKFQIEDSIFLNEPFDDETQWLLDALENTGSHRQLLLSTSLPGDKELVSLIPGAEYRLTRRGGFVQSDSYSDTSRKKQVQHFLAAGSVLPGRFASKVYCVGFEGSHPVYRFSGPILLGVDL